jgi:hypothetical protein
VLGHVLLGWQLHGRTPGARDQSRAAHVTSAAQWSDGLTFDVRRSTLRFTLTDTF